MRYTNYLSKIALTRPIYIFGKIPKYKFCPIFLNQKQTNGILFDKFIIKRNLFTNTTFSQKQKNLNLEELRIISETLNKTLNQVDIGNEVVISLLNDKRSLFKNLLEQNSPHEKGIKNILDKQSLLKYSPRSIEIANGVTKFFKGLSLLLNQKEINIEELEDKLAQICRDNGKMHYQMKVWFQAENWICLENSVIETIIKVNNLEKEKTFFVWQKLMQAVIGWMKQGFAEAEMKSKLN
uniref:Uncharacterized protein n=1 Tax=Meloidogyne enterolobii TaxID=390850 RepID=A0A6V7X213_MELEN|nr:unnamed protein product [Meloidogyne enterolobii]